MAAVSARRAWAVGNTLHGKTLIVRWNGTAWKRVRSPSPGVPDVLFGVAAASARSAWAVGSRNNAGSVVKTLILHWNGIAWKRVPSPSRSDRIGDVLTAVAAASARSAWAVGYTATSGGNSARILIVHWNGTAWKLS